MKLEFDIDDINRNEIIDAIARQLLTKYRGLDGESDTPSDLSRSLEHAVKQRIETIATELVRERFTEAIDERIRAAIDAVIADGWYDTDYHGGRVGERKDLRARINKELTAKRGDAYRSEPSILDKHIQEAIKTCLDKEFKSTIEAAKATLKAKLDEKVLASIAEGIKTAIGLR